MEEELIWDEKRGEFVPVNREQFKDYVKRGVDCTTVCENIVQGNIGIEDALDAFVEALRLDETESFHAAHIRDTIRDCYGDLDLESGTIEQALDNCREIVAVTPSITRQRQGRG